MKRILISEEERSRILGMHQEKGYKPLMEQGTPAQGTGGGQVAGGMGIKDQKLMYLGKEVKLPGLTDEKAVENFTMSNSNWTDYLGSYLMTKKLVTREQWENLKTVMNKTQNDAIAAAENQPKNYAPPEGNTVSAKMQKNSLFSLHAALQTMLGNLVYAGVDLKGQQPTKQSIIAAIQNPLTYTTGDFGDATNYLKNIPATMSSPGYPTQQWIKPLMDHMINTYLKLS